jgi:hypothetical protein
MNALLVAVVLASQPSLFDAPRQPSKIRLVAQADLQPIDDRAQLTAMRAEVSQRIDDASGPAPALLTILAFPNLISGGLFALGAVAGGSWTSGLLPVFVLVAVVRIGAAIAMWIAAGVMSSARANEREALEKKQHSLDAKLERSL